MKCLVCDKIEELSKDNMTGPFDNNKLYYRIEKDFGPAPKCINTLEIDASNFEESVEIIVGNKNKRINTDQKFVEICNNLINKSKNYFGKQIITYFDIFNTDAFGQLDEYFAYSKSVEIHIILVDLASKKMSGYVVDKETDQHKLFELFNQNNLFKHYFCELKTFEMINSKNVQDPDITEMLRKVVNNYLSCYQLPDSEIINTLSALAYERTTCSGSLVFINNFDEKIDVRFNRKVRIDMDNGRMIRKLLQMSNENVSLVCCGGYILGLTQTEEFINYKLVFRGIMDWDLFLNSNKIITCKKGKYIFTVDSDIKHARELKIKEFLGFNSQSEFDKIQKIIRAACEQVHGTLILIANDAETLSRRLCECGRGIKIEPPVELSECPLIWNLTSIDGALIIDQNGTCYAIGVILDGIACKESNIGRGARYNSAYAFVANRVNFESEAQEWKNGSEKCLAVVISEDETIDLISNNDIWTDALIYMRDEVGMHDNDDALSLLYE